jgi:uncharacterized protein
MRIQLSGTERLNAGLDTVRRFLTDPDQVGRCLPDLQELQVTGERSLLAFVRIGVGPIRGRFRMEAELEPAGEQIGLNLKGSGMGNGLSLTSRMALTAAGGATELAWSAEASVSGPLAGIGGRLLEGQAKKTIEQLFVNIRQSLE